MLARIECLQCSKEGVASAGYERAARAFAGEALGDCEADAAGGAGDEGVFALEGAGVC